MGLEARCELHLEDKTVSGKARLETEELIFRGEISRKIKLKEVQSVEAAEGFLRITSPEGTFILKLGAKADKWAQNIRNPKTRAEKLDVKPGVTVSICGLNDPAFVRELAERASQVAEGKPANDSDLIFLSVESVKDLARLKPLESALKRNGAIWIVYPKGRKDITETNVRQAGLHSGLVDVKVVRFSETHTALKFVIPLARR
jgi:hypothetical protein